MNKYIKEIIILLTQLLVFYVLPLFAGPTDTMGLILLMLILTLIISLIYGIISKNKIKYLVPVLTALVFIPTVFIHYNETALIHSVWYLATSSVGLIIGIAIEKLVNGFKK